MMIKRFVLVFFLLVGFVVVRDVRSENLSDSESTCELHVFVHGSYGSFFSLLSYPFVKRDQIKNTSYLKIQRRMRDTQVVHYRRFMSGPGIYEVSPGTDIPSNHPARYVIGAIHAMRSIVEPQRENELRYFLFGWSGLLSQRERRREAIRLYNELVDLTQKVEAEGKKPVVYVYGHSHGCNVMLNLALVDACAFGGEALLHKTTDKDAIACMKDLLAGSAQQELKDMLLPDDVKQALPWYAKPSKSLCKIKSLELYGVPVQPETAPLIASNLFDRVLQIYSENDGVLVSDHISSKKRSAIFFDADLLKDCPHVKVIRWMHMRTPLNECSECAQPVIKKESRLGMFEDLKSDRRKRLQDGGGNPDSHHPLDPTHADFWSIGNKRNGAFFEQVPLLVFVPFLHRMLEQATGEQLLDFCLQEHDQDSVIASLFAHKDLKAYEEIPLFPVKWAREGALDILNVRKKLEVGFSVTVPWFKNFSFVKNFSSPRA